MDAPGGMGQAAFLGTWLLLVCVAMHIKAAMHATFSLSSYLNVALHQIAGVGEAASGGA